MFTYAFARILSNIKKCSLHCEPLPNFKNTGNDIFPVVQPDDNAVSTNIFGGQHVSMEHILRTGNDVVVDSFLQKHIYYSEYRDMLKYLFAIDETGDVRPADDELVIHIRETDYIALNMVLGVKIYLKAIKELGYGRNTVVTDNCRSDIIRQLSDAGCSILSSQPVNVFSYSNNNVIMRDYSYMLHAKHLLISHSSFAWWPAFLGEHAHVYCPVVEGRSMWLKNPGKDDPELIMPNFIKLEH